MADIFNTQIPSWLQAIAKPADMSGAAKGIGMVIGGSLLAFQPDPDAKPVTDPETGEVTQPTKGFKKGLYEARMNQNDPNWRVKEKGLEASVVNNWARAAETWQQVDLNNRETAAWISHDLPALYKYRDELKDNPSAPAPVMESTRGTASLSKIQTGLSQAQIARTSAQTFQKMVEGLAAKGGAAAVVAGKYTQAIGSLPNQQVLQQFGKDIANLGLTEQDLMESSDLPVTKIITGPKGTTIQRGETRTSDSALYDQAPEVIEVGGKQFLKWGKQLRDLSNFSTTQKVEIELAKTRVNRLEAAVLKAPSGTAKEIEEKTRLTRSANIAREQLNKLIKPAPVSQSSAPTQAAPATAAPSQIFTDKSGKKFKYRGKMTDPAQDKDPNSWELVE